MPRYNKIKDRVYRSCAEIEYTGGQGSVERKILVTDAYPLLNTARGQRTRMFRRYYNRIALRKWDEFAELDWKMHI